MADSALNSGCYGRKITPERWLIFSNRASFKDFQDAHACGLIFPPVYYQITPLARRARGLLSRTSCGDGCTQLSKKINKNGYVPLCPENISNNKINRQHPASPLLAPSPSIRTNANAAFPAAATAAERSNNSFTASTKRPTINPRTLSTKKLHQFQTG